MKKANLEIIQPAEGSSFFMAYNKAPHLCHTDFWHFHPEFEIVYVPHGRGKRFVGHKISEFIDGDLVLLGPNIPHNAFNFGFESTGFEEYVIQFKGAEIEKLSDAFPEFSRIANLLTRAGSGIGFNGASKHRIGDMIKQMQELPCFQRLMQLFQILREMAVSNDSEDLEAKKFVSVPSAHKKRIEQVYRIIQEKYQGDLSTRHIASELAMTESSFCRFFKNTTGKTFKEALTEIRIQKARTLLMHSDLSLAGIASQSGFNNISLFNRFFKDATQTTPNKYRNSIRINLDPAKA